METLLKVLREKAFDKKPSVDELKKIAGLESVTAKERDKAWKAFQDEKQAQSKATSESEPGSEGEGGTGTDTSESEPGSEGEGGADTDTDTGIGGAAEQNTTTATTATTDSEPDAKPETQQDASPSYRVTVKKEGFRRLGRAWTGSSDVELSDDEVAVLEADPMFSVVKL